MVRPEFSTVMPPLGDLLEGIFDAVLADMQGRLVEGRSEPVHTAIAEALASLANAGQHDPARLATYAAYKAREALQG